MTRAEIEEVVKAVQARIARDPEDAKHFDVQTFGVGEEDEVVYVPIQYKQGFDAPRRYEKYVRLGAIGSDVMASTGRALSLVPGVQKADHNRLAKSP